MLAIMTRVLIANGHSEEVQVVKPAISCKNLIGLSVAYGYLSALVPPKIFHEYQLNAAS